MIRVLIADDHEMVREGLTLFLGEAAGIAVLGQARDGAEALALARAWRPDVLLLDLVIPRMDGIEVTRHVKAEGVAGAVLILTTFADEERVREAVRAGATGFLLKDIPRGELVRAIHAAAEGRPTLSPAAQESLMRQVAAPPAQEQPFSVLTEREREVLVHVAEGYSNKEIAARLGLTVGTVKGYVSAILTKLGVADRTQAAVFALRHGLIRQND